MGDMYMFVIYINRDHFVDQPSRARTKQRKSKYSNVAGPREPTRDVKPIGIHHRKNEQYITATNRLDQCGNQ
jgi:hypothetical protein